MVDRGSPAPQSCLRSPPPRAARESEVAVQGHVTVCLLVYDTDTCVAVGTVCTWILWLCPSAHECVCTVTICTWALWLCPWCLCVHLELGERGVTSRRECAGVTGMCPLAPGAGTRVLGQPK